jgi:hypothetical protein
MLGILKNVGGYYEGGNNGADYVFVFIKENA